MSIQKGGLVSTMARLNNVMPACAIARPPAAPQAVEPPLQNQGAIH
jgi:hypothetical protein